MSGNLSLFDWPTPTNAELAPASSASGASVAALGAQAGAAQVGAAQVGAAKANAISASGPTAESGRQSIEASANQIVVFDVETTGTDRTCDQVIELCAQFGLGDDAPSRTWRFKPSVAISPGAQAVHGITAEALADCPSFADCIDELTTVFANANVFVGYNLAFDIDMLAAEFTRLGRTPVDFSEKTIVDPFRLWQQ